MKRTKKLKLTAILLSLSVLVGCTPAATSSTEALGASSQTIASSSVAPPVSSKAPVSGETITSSDSAAALNLKTEDLEIYLHSPLAGEDAYIDANGQLKFTEEGRKKVSDPEKYENIKNVVSVWEDSALPYACIALQQDGTATVIFYDKAKDLYVGKEDPWGMEYITEEEWADLAAYFELLQQFLNGKKFKSIRHPYFLTTDGDCYEIASLQPYEGKCEPVLIGTDVVYADGALMLLADGRICSWKYYIPNEEWADIVQVSRPKHVKFYAFGLRSDGSVVVWNDERNHAPLHLTTETVVALIPGSAYARTADGRLLCLAQETMPICDPEAPAVYYNNDTVYELQPDGTLLPIKPQPMS